MKHPHAFQSIIRLNPPKKTPFTGQKRSGWWFDPLWKIWESVGKDYPIYIHILPIGSMYGIYTNIGGILMGSMLPYIAAPWILWVMENKTCSKPPHVAMKRSGHFWWSDIPRCPYLHSSASAHHSDGRWASTCPARHTAPRGSMSPTSGQKMTKSPELLDWLSIRISGFCTLGS